ncbi:MAG: hypothetical protein A2Y12_03395 [Planctomycetes bacterium GWF2_42_9]|nr:MAG: hypothetical protein A2Y12_03395 [Planctomycetes bacterium GWF2_42_9]HAL45116.1 hypothetical protein [Phycisphaerales bacterium]
MKLIKSDIKNCYAIAVVCLFFAAFGYSAGQGGTDNLPAATAFVESRMEKSFEMGNSLISAKIISVYSLGGEKHHRRKNYYYYTAEIKPIIAGDMVEKDFDESVELTVGSYTGSLLKPGKTYAIFAYKDSLNGFYWADKDDFVELTKGNTKAVREMAEKVYSKTQIFKFRQSSEKQEVKLPELPQEIAAACEQFKANPENRTRFAEVIYESQLGSRKDNNVEQKRITYLRPEIILSRDQIVALLGEPTIKWGWTYKWYCGQEEVPGLTGQVGVLTVVFDKEYNDTVLVYAREDKLKWVN